MAKGLLSRFLSVGAAAACVLLATLIARVPLSAAAAPGDADAPLRVELAAPRACPTTPDLVERVRRHTPRVREAKPGESARRLEVRVTGDERRFVAKLRLVEGNEALERQVPGRTCEEVLAAVALIAAFAIDPSASARPSSPDEREPPLDHSDAGEEGGALTRASPRPPASLDFATRPPPAREPPSRLQASFGLALEAHGLGELVIGRSLWAEGTLTTRGAPSLRLRVLQTQSFTVEPEGRPAFFQLSAAAIEGCVTTLGTSGVLELRPCAQISGGILEGASSAFGPPRRSTRGWAGLGAILQGRWTFLGPLMLEVAAGITLPLIRDDFFFLPQIDVYRAPPAVLVGNVGVGTTFR